MMLLLALQPVLVLALLPMVQQQRQRETEKEREDREDKGESKQEPKESATRLRESLRAVGNDIVDEEKGNRYQEARIRYQVSA